MINEPTVVIECDHCCETVELEMEIMSYWKCVIKDYNDCSEKSICKELKEEGWIANKDRQYCSKKCKKEQEEEE